MHHAKTDSEVTLTSLAPSSPTRSTRPAYYVQSPSRDSRDGDKTGNSTPMGSPPRSSIGNHSRQSSTSRYSGTLKPGGSRKITPNDPKGQQQSALRKDTHVIEEEGLLDDDDDQEKGWPRRYYVLAFLLGFFVLFTLFSLILYGAAKPQKPKITVKSITFERFSVQAGSDDTGVATDMITVNSSLKFTYRNTGTFFGTHVTSTPIELSYSKLAIATGTMEKFYQSRKSQRTVGVMVIGDRIPLYGSGAGLNSPQGTPTLPVPLTLGFRLRSRAYVLGRLVKPKFYRRIDCDITFDPRKLNKALSLKNNCTYT